MAYETILVERKGAVAIIRMNRPDKLNAMNTRLKEETTHALGDLEKDDSVRVAVITGVGDKAFIAGADINEFAGKKPIDQWQSYGHTSLYNVVDRFPKPILAMINGYCLGGGCELAMACDIRIASDRARIGQPEINIGIIAGFGGTQRLPRLVGPGRAAEILLTGDLVDASSAERIGLVDRVVPHDRLLEEAKALASRIASKGAMAVALTKACLRAAQEMPLSAGLSYETAAFGIVGGTEDRAEGMRAFLEKRPPAWKGV